MRKFIIILLLFFSLNSYAKKEIGLGAGGLGYGISFKDNFNDYNSYRITGFAYLAQLGDSFWDKHINLSLQYNHTIKRTSNEDFYLLVATSFLYSIEYSGSLTDYRRYNYYKGALGFGINKVFFEFLSLSLDIYQVIHFENSYIHVDSGHLNRRFYSYPAINLYLAIIF